MTKIDVFSGFLGSGKTTLIKKLIKEAYASEKVVLIENEFGEIGIDGAFLKDAGVEITEMNSGCICCSLVGDFSKALEKVINDFSPDRILIEPSGVGKLSDVISAVEKVIRDGVVLNSYTTVVDVNKCKMYMKNFGEFFNNQIEHAATIVLSHVGGASEDKISSCIKLLREHNDNAIVITTDWEKLDGKAILSAMEGHGAVSEHLEMLEKEHHEHHHHDEECECHEHHHHHDEECECHEHHHHHGEECECHEHHHHHGEECECHEHHHHHDEHCCCGHDHHGEHHHADEVFSSWGIETTKKYTVDKISEILNSFSEDDSWGMVLRAKGVLEGVDGDWIHFDYVPGEPDVRCGCADIIGRICVIGSGLSKEKIAEMFE